MPAELYLPDPISIIIDPENTPSRRSAVKIWMTVGGPVFSPCETGRSTSGRLRR